MIKTCHRLLAFSFLGTALLASHPACADERIAITIQPRATVCFTDLTADNSVNVAAPIQQSDRILSQAEPAPTSESKPPEANNPRIPLSSRIFAVSTMQQ
ncbi:MAG: hypothetical protein LH660_14830 [Phormidesmis sp. CAN_BIN36]|nr:hypothetical protein [Phormidesmis sp. CAN_BIN36]